MVGSATTATYGCPISAIRHVVIHIYGDVYHVIVKRWSESEVSGKKQKLPLSAYLEILYLFSHGVSTTTAINMLKGKA